MRIGSGQKRKNIAARNKLKIRLTIFRVRVIILVVRILPCSNVFVRIKGSKDAFIAIKVYFISAAKIQRQ